eukprot:UN23271
MNSNSNSRMNSMPSDSGINMFEEDSVPKFTNVYEEKENFLKVLQNWRSNHEHAQNVTTPEQLIYIQDRYTDMKKDVGVIESIVNSTFEYVYDYCKDLVPHLKKYFAAESQPFKSVSLNQQAPKKRSFGNNQFQANKNLLIQIIKGILSIISFNQTL